MRVIRDELWRHPGMPGMIVVTTNSTLRHHEGSLVMGRGAALEAVMRIPRIDVECGRAIAAFAFVYGHDKYGFLPVRIPTSEKVGFGIFQVKHFWGDPADLSLIEHAVLILVGYANMNPDINIRMNYPGIGNGKLQRAEVEPLLAPLPDNVTICCK